MKPIGENEKGEVIYNELSCDICEEMSGPRTRFDICLNCQATRDERVKAGHWKLIDMYLSNHKKIMDDKAKRLEKKYHLKIDVSISYEIEDYPINEKTGLYLAAKSVRTVPAKPWKKLPLTLSK